jgi:hypothetical protein
MNAGKMRPANSKDRRISHSYNIGPAARLPRFHASPLFLQNGVHRLPDLPSCDHTLLV